eukprot:COSAG01_NODE_66093_length_271_cov_0.656977_1_plen_60_part_01
MLRGVAAVEGLSRRERQTARLAILHHPESRRTEAHTSELQAVRWRGSAGAGEGGSGGAQP